MSFSERHGYKPVRAVVQRESMDAALRTSLWNVLEVFFWKARRGQRRATASDSRGNHITDLAPTFWANYFKAPIDTIPPWWDQTINAIRDLFFSCSWKVGPSGSRASFADRVRLIDDAKRLVPLGWSRLRLERVDRMRELQLEVLDRDQHVQQTSVVETRERLLLVLEHGAGADQPGFHLNEGARAAAAGLIPNLRLARWRGLFAGSLGE